MPDVLCAVIWLLASGALSIIFVCVSVQAVKRTAPAQFWPWLKIKGEDLNNVQAYNQELCTMWMSCAFCFLVNGIVGLFSRQLAMAFYRFFLFPGFWLLSRRYRQILHRYLKRGAAEVENPDICSR